MGETMCQSRREYILTVFQVIVSYNAGKTGRREYILTVFQVIVSYIAGNTGRREYILYFRTSLHYIEHNIYNKVIVSYNVDNTGQS